MRGIDFGSRLIFGIRRVQKLLRATGVLEGLPVDICFYQNVFRPAYVLQQQEKHAAVALSSIRQVSHLQEAFY